MKYEDNKGRISKKKERKKTEKGRAKTKNEDKHSQFKKTEEYHCRDLLNSFFLNLPFLLYLVFS